MQSSSFVVGFLDIERLEKVFALCLNTRNTELNQDRDQRTLIERFTGYPTNLHPMNDVTSLRYSYIIYVKLGVGLGK